MVSRNDKILLNLLCFFSMVFTTTFIGPAQLKLSPVRIVIILIALKLLYGVIQKKGKLTCSNGKVIYPVVFYTFWFIYAVVISLIMSVDLGISLNAIVYILIGLILYLFLVQVQPDMRTIRSCLITIVVGLIINNIIAWYELITNQYLFTLSSDMSSYFTRHGFTVSFFANPNNFCLLLGFGFFVCMGLLLSTKNMFMRVVCIGVMISSVLIMIANVAQSNIIGVVLGGIVWLLLYLRRQGNVKRWHIFVALAILVVALFMSGKIFMFLSSYLRSVEDILRDSSSTMGYRFLFIRNAISGLISKWGFGVGAGNSIYYVYGDYTLGNVHNWFIEILVDYGVVIFMGYVWLYAKQIVSFAKKTIYGDIKSAWIYKVFCVILVSYLVSNISSSTMFTYEFMWVYWAFALYLYQYNKGEHPDNEEFFI